jgi:hypothetical protein
MRSFSRARSILLTLAITAGCAPPAARVPMAARAPAMPAIPPDAPRPGEWATWSHDQKLAYMKSGFMVAERAIFAAWEPVRYRDLSCRTCHGPGVDDGYRMPNIELTRPIRGVEGFRELAAQEPEVLRFMQKAVVPATARLLGLPEFDMTAHTGFGCWQCHVPQEDK